MSQQHGREGLGNWNYRMHTDIYGMTPHGDLLYSKENIMQHSMIIYVRKEYEQELICV